MQLHIHQLMLVVTLMLLRPLLKVGPPCLQLYILLLRLRLLLLQPVCTALSRFLSCHCIRHNQHPLRCFAIAHSRTHPLLSVPLRLLCSCHAPCCSCSPPRKPAAPNAMHTEAGLFTAAAAAAAAVAPVPSKAASAAVAASSGVLRPTAGAEHAAAHTPADAGCHADAAASPAEGGPPLPAALHPAAAAAAAAAAAGLHCLE
mmetsp:Transcript_9042/g.22890  ORF Transcript_9042/g.22890 Transcript_9042/m.22890 type:complete len:202 (-) Transcript_9042:218-823(-)